MKKHKAVLTQSGAERVGHPRLAGEQVEYTVSKSVNGAVCADDVFYQNRRIAGIVSFTGNTPGLIDKDENWKRVL